MDERAFLSHCGRRLCDGATEKLQAQNSRSRCQKQWQESGVYHFDPACKPVFSIDTPPATVSGHLHLGHIYSYSHPDFMARFWRMNGHNVFYPMGYDDNGLPTGRLVESRAGITARKMGREEFARAMPEIGAE